MPTSLNIRPGVLVAHPRLSNSVIRRGNVKRPLSWRTLPPSYHTWPLKPSSLWGGLISPFPPFPTGGRERGGGGGSLICIAPLPFLAVGSVSLPSQGGRVNLSSLSRWLRSMLRLWLICPVNSEYITILYLVFLSKKGLFACFIFQWENKQSRALAKIVNK